MVAVRISPFGGMVPAVDDGLLAPVNAALAENTWTYSGNVVGLPKRKLLRTLTNPNAEKVYRLPNNYTDSLHLADSTWMEFASANTDVLRTQVVNDTYDRYYWASPLDVPRYMTQAQIIASAPALAGAYKLGIPAPGAISGTVSGGVSGTLKSVAYVQTFVSAYGEEGQPSAPKTYTAQKIDATYTITFAQPDPLDMGTNRNITKMRLYRTITAANGTTTYFFVTEVVTGTVSYADNAAVNTDAVIALNAELESTNWQGPPADLQGWVSLSNGIVAGFRTNEIWFCEPYRMHAWPALYVLAVEYPIVGLGVQNNALVVCTDGFVYTINGVHPASMSLQKVAGLMPCTSRGSIISAVEGVYFSTPAGLALVTAGGVVIATKELIRKDKWNALVQINTLRAAMLGPAYYAFGQKILGVFQQNAFQVDAFQQDDFGGARNGMLIDPTSLTVAFNKLSDKTPITNVMTDVWSNEVFIIQSGQVQHLDISDTTQTRDPYIWRSKIFQAGDKKNFQAMKVFFKANPTWSINYVQDGPIPNMEGPTTSGVTMSADGEYAPAYAAWKAGAGQTDQWISEIGGTPFPHYLNIQLSTATLVTSYSFRSSTTPASLQFTPKSWTLQGSNDGINFTIIDTVVDEPDWVSGELRSYNIDTAGTYLHYRIVVTKNQLGTGAAGTTYVVISSFQLGAPVLGIVRVYADDAKVMQRYLVRSGEQWRLPSGFKADFWQFEVEAAVEVENIQVATSPTELRTI